MQLVKLKTYCLTYLLKFAILFMTRLVGRLTFSNYSDGAYNCPKDSGQFEDLKQCDKYYDCIDGIPREKYCPDGLVFDPLNRKINKCDHVFNVDCGDRNELRKKPHFLLITITVEFLTTSSIRPCLWPRLSFSFQTCSCSCN